MALDERDVRQAPEVEPKSTGLGLLKGLSVTLKHALRPSITQQYPQEKPDLPPRTRGVIALKEANCTVCYKCSRECPDWCIYIDAHKETHEPASGGKGRSMKVLDRFAIDYALCMYCGICVEVCPFDALFWSPEFEYSEYDIVELTHEKEKLEEWTYTVLPPPMIEDGAEVPPEHRPWRRTRPDSPRRMPRLPRQVRRRPLRRPLVRRHQSPLRLLPLPPLPAAAAPGCSRCCGGGAGSGGACRSHGGPGDVRPGSGRAAGAGDRPACGRGAGETRGDGGRAREGRGRLVTGAEIAFVIVGVAAVVGAFRVVTARNVVRAALYLVVTLSAVAGVYLLLAAEFVAWVQILIYVGAIVILFLFGLMLTKAPIGREALDNQRRGVAFLVAVAILGGLVYLIQGAFDWDAPRIDPIEGSVASVGTSLFSRFVLPFEVISLLLLAALIGAIVLSRKEDRP